MGAGWDEPLRGLQSARRLELLSDCLAQSLAQHERHFLKSAIAARLARTRSVPVTVELRNSNTAKPLRFF